LGPAVSLILYLTSEHSTMAFQQTVPQTCLATATSKVSLCDMLNKEATTPFFSLWDGIDPDSETYFLPEWKLKKMRTQTWDAFSSSTDDGMDDISTEAPSRQSTAGSTTSQGTAFSYAATNLLSINPSLQGPLPLGFYPPPGLALPESSRRDPRYSMQAPLPKDLPVPGFASGALLPQKVKDTLDKKMRQAHRESQSHSTLIANAVQRQLQMQSKSMRADNNEKYDDLASEQRMLAERMLVHLSSDSAVTAATSYRTPLCPQCGDESKPTHSFCMWCGHRL